MLKDTHIDIKFSLAGEKKQYHLTFAECFLDKYKPLDANICFTKTPIPCRMIFKKKTPIPCRMIFKK